jgi:hypothetical protein
MWWADAYAPNTHRFCPGVHVAGFSCTGNVVRAVRVQPFVGSPGRRPLPLNRVRRRLCHSDLVVTNQLHSRPQAPPASLLRANLGWCFSRFIFCRWMNSVDFKDVKVKEAIGNDKHKQPYEGRLQFQSVATDFNS